MNNLKKFEQFAHEPDEPTNAPRPVDQFAHHRLLAGYYEHREKAFAALAQDAASASDPRTQKIASDYEKRRVQMAEKRAFHGYQADELHRPEIHGDWNDTIPSEEECKLYFRNQ